MSAPVIKNPIPAQIINEQAAYGPFDLKPFVESDEEGLIFRAEIEEGYGLPRGLICTENGLLTGIPAKGTEGNYEITLTVENKSGSIQTVFMFTIKPSLLNSDIEYADKLKKQIWEALENHLPIPELGELYDRPVTIQDIYYLLERWASLIIWDAFNLEPPGEKHLLKLEGMSDYFNVYDRGSCIVATPKDLYDHRRTTAHALQTARAMAQEVYKRGWTIEFAGFDKMTRAAWVELQHLGDKHGKRLEILNFNPSMQELHLYNEEARLLFKNRPEPQ